MADADADAILETVNELNDQVGGFHDLGLAIAAERGYSEAERDRFLDRMHGQGWIAARSRAIERYGDEEDERVFHEAAHLWVDAVIAIRGGEAVA